jgi:hypothetical protein
MANMNASSLEWSNGEMTISREKSKNLEKNPIHSHFVLHESHL